ncbi:MAG: hypothetical protein IIB95_14280, partial [Candidatus Marinimicrobia bacterium]|nr:hypothetical protein [Candidatus Neomarinimicrobiota bacterium]
MKSIQLVTAIIPIFYFNFMIQMMSNSTHQIQSNSTHYPAFPSLFIHAAILLAFFAGINVGSHIAYVVGNDLPLGKGYHTFIQIHGHLQLMGWAGLFIMGVSLYFLPRLTHIEIKPLKKSTWILWLMVSGLLLRFICHSLIPYIDDSPWYSPISLLVVLSGTLVFLSILLYLTILIQIIKKSFRKKITDNRKIALFVLLTMLGWLIYALGNQVLLIIMIFNHEIALMHNWNYFLIDLFIHFSIFSICMAVGIRTLPLFMRLPVIKWNVEKFAWTFATLLFIIFGGKILYHFVYHSSIAYIIYISSLLKDFLMIWFILKINILFRTRPPWTTGMKKERIPHRKEPRKNLPDYGEFGRFEWLIKPAFFWLLIGLLFDIIIQFSLLTKRITEISADGVRHIYLLGFISLLIIGMAVRMIPGMTGIRKLTRPKWVAPLAIIVNIAVFLRVFTLVLPTQFISAFPG